MSFRLLLLPFLIASAASAQTAEQVVRETQRLKGLVDQEHRTLAQDSLQQARWRAQAAERLALMRQDAARLGRERDSLQAIADRAFRPKPTPAPKASAASRRKAFSLALAGAIEGALPRLSRELDAGGDLRARWTDLANGLRSGAVEPEDALAPFLDDLAERIDLAGRVECVPGSYVQTSGRTLRGRWLRVGGWMEAFVERDDGVVALRRFGEPKAAEDLPETVRAALVRAVAVAQGEAAPGWLLLPLGGGAP